MLLRNNSADSVNGLYSSFHSTEEILGEVVERLIKNERLKKLLYWTDPNALKLEKVNSAQTLEILQEQFSIVPRLKISEYAKPYIILALSNFYPEENNPYYRKFELQIDVICPFDVWQLKDFKLRPYAIAGEIDGMIDKNNLNRNGIANFKHSKTLILGNNRLGGVTLCYQVTPSKDSKIENG